ncbi:MAG TPA: rhomboid family intramembrane serine protease [Blastocatellia bacterium]|nr:rhomboid family intramembrane serine protease [Blastocatellia bacterium]
MNQENLKLWEVQSAIPPKPTDSDYGYFESGVLHPCSREELIDRVRKLNLSELSVPQVLVWTPETSEIVAPQEVPYLFEALKARMLKSASDNLRGSVIIAAIFLFVLVLILATQELTKPIVIVVAAFLFLPAVLLLFYGLSSRRNLKDTTPESIRPIDYKYAAWLNSYKLTWTRDIAVCILAVGLLQIFADGGIESSGLVKAKVRNGQYWRLLTCGFLHGNFWHFFLNFNALIALGRMVEVFLHRSHLAIVFLLSVISGSICSVVLIPNKTSIGASGGLLGLVGLLVIAGWKRKSVLPENFLSKISVGIVVTALIGLVGFLFIDNAAHLGGLVCGLVLGLIFLWNGDNSFPLRPNKIINALGWVSMSIIFLGAVIAALQMYKDRLGTGLVYGLAAGVISFGFTRLKY